MHARQGLPQEVLQVGSLGWLFRRIRKKYFTFKSRSFKKLFLNYFCLNWCIDVSRNSPSTWPAPSPDCLPSGLPRPPSLPSSSSEVSADPLPSIRSTPSRPRIFTPPRTSGIRSTKDLRRCRAEMRPWRQCVGHWQRSPTLRCLRPKVTLKKWKKRLKQRFD